MKDLQISYLKSSVANQDVPQDHAFFAKLYDFANENGIKYVLTGSNLTSESILPSSWGYDATDSRQLLAIHKKFGCRELKTFPTMSLFANRIYWPYIKKMERIDPLNFLDYDKNKTIEFLKENYSWKYYGGKHHESKWTKFFQAYYLPRKFGYDKRRAHLSSLIVANQISRSDALSELEASLYNEEDLRADKEFVARKLSLTAGELESLIGLPNKTYRDYPNQENTLKSFRKVKHALS